MLLWVCRPPCDADYFLDIWLGLIANASLYIYIWCYSFGRGFGLLSTSTSCVYKYMNMELIVSRGAFALHQFGSTHTHTQSSVVREESIWDARYSHIVRLSFFATVWIPLRRRRRRQSHNTVHVMVGQCDVTTSRMRARRFAGSAWDRLYTIYDMCV